MSEMSLAILISATKSPEPVNFEAVAVLNRLILYSPAGVSLDADAFQFVVVSLNVTDFL